MRGLSRKPQGWHPLLLALFTLVRERGILRSSQRVGSSEKLASLGPFIVNSSPLAMVMVGWVYLLSSSFSFPELLVGFPKAHPSHLLYFSGECVEDKVSEVRRGSLSSLCLSAPCRCPPSPTPGRGEVIG